MTSGNDDVNKGTQNRVIIHEGVVKKGGIKPPSNTPKPPPPPPQNKK